MTQLFLGTDVAKGSRQQVASSQDCPIPRQYDTHLSLHVLPRVACFGAGGCHSLYPF